jgi:protein-disulfide isomerase
MKMNKKALPIIIALLAVASFLAGRYSNKFELVDKTKTTGGGTAQVTTTPAPQAAQTVTLDQVKGLFKQGNIFFGKADQKVLFVEVSDPSCPYCQVAAGKNPTLNAQIGERFKLVSDGGTYVAPVPEMRKLVESGKAGYVWLYYSGHGNGEMATKALYCAFDEGKFWQVHDLLNTAAGYDLINNQVKNDKTKANLMVNFLKSAVDSNKLSACLTGSKYDSRPASDMAIGKSLGVSGTPMFIVNTTLFGGAYSYTDMKSTVDNLLK